MNDKQITIPKKIFWWFNYICILQPVRILFHYALPPILKYFWHNGVFYHLAQDDKNVYEDCKCIGDDVPYGNHPRETSDIIIPDYGRFRLNEYEEKRFSFSYIKLLFKSIVKDTFDLLTCYPRFITYSILRKTIYKNIYKPLDMTNLTEKETEIYHLLKGLPIILFIHGGVRNI